MSLPPSGRLSLTTDSSGSGHAAKIRRDGQTVPPTTNRLFAVPIADLTQLTTLLQQLTGREEVLFDQLLGAPRVKAVNHFEHAGDRTQRDAIDNLLGNARDQQINHAFAADPVQGTRRLDCRERIHGRHIVTQNVLGAWIGNLVQGTQQPNWGNSAQIPQSGN
ncbi:MAG: hypothetical protein ACI8UD_001302 [Planctomycetota bacterium]|jgi:hypothetical protein